MNYSEVSSVINLYNNYHKKVKQNPSLYISEDSIDLYLPNTLKGYANAASGHHGYKRHYAPKGIRLRSDNPEQDVKTIFSSVNTLIQFIVSPYNPLQ